MTPDQVFVFLRSVIEPESSSVRATGDGARFAARLGIDRAQVNRALRIGAMRSTLERWVSSLRATYPGVRDGFVGASYVSAFMANVDRRGPDECWLWIPGASGKPGYGRYSPNRELSDGAHRFAFNAFRGDPGDLCVLHTCDVRLCVNPSHLFLGTLADNNRDRAAKGRSARGERHWSRSKSESVLRGDNHPSHLHPERLRRGESHPSAVLTEEKVRDIRQSFTAGESKTSIARRLSCGRTTVSRVLNGTYWKHV